MLLPNAIKRTLIGALSSAVVLVPVPSLADSYEDEVRTQLLGASLIHNLGGYSLDDTYLDILSEDGVDRLEVTLRRGVSYSFIGVCDRDCGDLDLYLYDESGNTVDYDNSEDDYPIVEVTPRWTGDFEVKVEMYDCNASYCHYGIGKFSD